MFTSLFSSGAARPALATPQRDHTRPRSWWYSLGPVVLFSLLVACGGSGGGGCGTPAKIKGGFPVDKRVPGAVELRVTQNFFTFLEANAKTLLGPLLPATGIPIPSTCTGDTQICCGQMCKVKTELTSLKIDPVPPSTLRMTIRTKLVTEPKFKVKIPVAGNCEISINTERSGAKDVGLVLPILARTNGETSLTNIDFDANNIDIKDLDNNDLSIDGGFLCDVADFLKGLFIGTLKDQLKKQLGTPLSGLFCQACMTKDDCSSLANEGCAMGKCMRKGTCMQQIGAEGRMDLASLVAGIPGAAQNASLDYFAVAGGHADVEPAPSGGLSLGMLGGARSATRAACAPMRPAPTRPAGSLGKTAAYTGNTTPVAKKPYHVGLGLSTLELDLLGHGFYESGGLCLSIGTEQVDLLSSATLGILIPSLGDLTRGQPSALKIALRPQQPPVFTLGKGTFKNDAMGKRVIDDPLLHIKLKDLAMDFYVFIDERPVRFMRQTVDLDLPLSLDVDGKNQIVPLLGDLATGFGNVRVSESALLAEPPAKLAQLLPSLLPLLLGSLGSSLGPIALPDLMGIKLEPVEITSTMDKTNMQLAYLGIFLGLKQAMMLQESAAPPAPPVETFADLVSLEVPALDRLRDETAPVQVTLQLGATAQSTDVEWQLRLENSLWQPFDARRFVTLSDPVLRLPGVHRIEVRARRVGQPDSLDPTPAVVTFSVSPASASLAGQPAAAQPAAAAAHGCSVASHSPASAQNNLRGLLALLAVSLTAAALLRRGRPSRTTRLFAVGLLLLSGAVGCKKDGDMNGNGPQSAYGSTDEIGRYQSAVVHNNQIYIAAYNSNYGDLAFTQVPFAEAQTATLTWFPVDGLPQGSPTLTSKDAFRGGYDDPADDVGRFAALGMTKAGTPIIAYQDVTNGLVKLAARPDKDKPWQITPISPMEGKPGAFTTLLLDDNDVPMVAYLVTGLRPDKASGKVVSQLVLARAQVADPAGNEGWQRTVIEEEPVSCAGHCDMNEVCVYSDPSKKDRLATVCKPIAGTCTPSCPNGQACVANACQPILSVPATAKLDGTGLYARLVRSPSGAALFFHNANTGAVKFTSAPEWKVVTLDGGDGKSKVGESVGAVIGSDGTVHVAYGDFNGPLRYRTFKSGTQGPIETIDNGERMVAGATELHFIGAGVQLILDGDQPVAIYQDQTTGVLETARRSPTGWTHQTLGSVTNQSRGFYPQAVQQDGRWLVLDVLYDRAANALSSVAFSPL